jgi:purine catabolism regulator
MRTVKAANVGVTADPWRWLAPRDLLMMSSDALPAEPRDQRVLVQLLDRRGIAGLAVSCPESTPAFSQTMCETANRAGFPLLEVDWSTPFAELAAFVSERNAQKGRAGLLKVVTVHEAYAGRASEELGPYLADDVSSMVGLQLELVDVDSGCSLFTRRKEDVEIRLARRLGGSGRGQESDLITTVAGHQYRVLRVGRQRSVSLWTAADQDVLDHDALTHLRSFFSTAVDQHFLAQQRDNDLLQQALRKYLKGAVGLEQVLSALSRRGLGQPPWHVIDMDSEASADMLSRLSRSGIPHLAMPYSGGVSILVDALKYDENRIDDGGVQQNACSDRFWTMDSFVDAAQSAAWKRHHILAQSARPGLPVHRLVPPRLNAAREFVESVLGGLLTYDECHRSDLVRSLEVFMAKNRSWESASLSLHVHRQTLRYRLSRVTDLTGRRLDNMDDLVDLHMALKIHRIMDAVPFPAFATAGKMKPSASNLETHQPTNQDRADGIWPTGGKDKTVRDKSSSSTRRGKR